MLNDEVTLNEILKQEHDSTAFVKKIDKDLSILCDWCYECGFENKRQLISVKKLNNDFMISWHKILTANYEKIKKRLMMPKKVDNSWGMYCEICYYKK